MSTPKNRGFADVQPDIHNPDTSFRGDNRTDGSRPGAADSDESEWLPSDRRAALAKLKRLVSPLPEMRNEAVLNEIRARQKRRDLGFKRNDVSASDERFIRELQKLRADRQLDLFPELLPLADNCQETRNVIGPLDADYNEIEQEVEWNLSELQSAEESLYEYLDALLQSKDIHFSIPPSATSSHHELSPTRGNSQYPESEYSDTHHDVSYQGLPPEDPLALEELQPASTSVVEQSVGPGQILVGPSTTDPGGDIDQSVNSGPRSTGYSYYSAATLNGGIDRPLASVPEPIFHIPTVPYQYKPLYDIENYPKLLLDFTTVRDRVARWLLHSLLVSRWEAERLKCRFDAENPKAPSNWAQLVLTWWAIDAATAPDTRKHQDQDAPSWQMGPAAFVAILLEQKYLASLLQKAPRTLGALIFTEVFRNLLDGLFTALSQEAQDKTTIAAVRNFQDTRIQIVKLVRERLYGEESGSMAPVVKTKGNNPNKHINSHSEYATADDHSSVFPDAMPKDLPTPIPDNHNWDHAKQSEKRGLANTFSQCENTNSTDDAYETSKISLREDHEPINPMYENGDAGNVERRYDKSEHDRYSTSTEYVKDFVLKSAAFATFQRNLAELWKEQMDKIINQIECERPPTPKVEKGETISQSAVQSEIRLLAKDDNTMLVLEMQNTRLGPQSTPSTEDIKPMTITKAPDLEFDGPALSAVVRSPSSQDSNPHLPSSERSEPLTIRSENGTAVPVTPAGKANGKTRFNERSHQSEVSAVPGSSPSETTPTPSSEKQIWEDPTPKIERNCPVPLDLEDLRPIQRESERTRDQRTQNGHEFGLANTSALRRFKDYGTLTSPIRSPTGKRAKRTEGPVTPARSPTVAQSEGASQLSPASNRKRVRKSDQDLVPDQALWTRPSPPQFKWHMSKQHEKSERMKLTRQADYREHDQRDFKRGKVFKVMEPKSSDGEDGIVISARSEKDGDTQTPRVRRFVVIEQKSEHCVCFSITSHNGLPPSKDGGNIENQAAIYPESQTPPRTPGMTRTAIAVKIPYPYHKLGEDSRVDYEKAYQVAYDVKVCFIGDVSRDSERILVAAYQELHPSPEIPRAHSPVPSLSATNSTTSGMEPQSPTFGTGRYDGFSFRPGPRSGFSQSSVDSATPILHRFPQHGDEWKHGWEATQSRGIPLPYRSRPPTPSASNQHADPKREQNQSPKPKLPNNAEQRDDT